MTQTINGFTFNSSVRQDERASRNCGLERWISQVFVTNAATGKMHSIVTSEADTQADAEQNVARCLARPW